MDNNYKIVAITVTYNSAKLLEKTIDSILSGTYKVSDIIIVDNASNSENKRALYSIKNKSNCIKLIELEENTGGAGGFETGMRYAHKNLDYDYLWIMDDDAYPTETCLVSLLKYTHLENIGALCPLIYGIDNKQYQLYHHKNLRRLLTKDEMAYKSYDSIPKVGKVEANAFVGPLIPKRIVEDVGFPDGRLFIYGDDTEYTYRISRKYNVYLIKGAVINHRDINAAISINPKSLWKDYYMYRNRLLLENLYLKNYFIRKFANFITILGIKKRINFIKKLNFDKEIYKNYYKNMNKAIKYIN